MTPLRMRMIEDMRTAGLTSGMQAIYLDGVRRLAAHYGRSPDLLSEEEVRAYLIGLRERGVALGTFKTNHGGIQFLYRQTLDRDWQLFGEKKDPPTETAAPADCFTRQPGQGPPGLCRQPCASDVPFLDVWLRFADRRGGNSGDRRDRQRQQAVAHHRQGQQAAARAVTAASPGRSACAVAGTPQSALAVSQT
jgi:hypothetical protein